ncbi:MAG TPA: hypothetical protein VH682_10540 [Gemmataceae bacterium]
MSHRLFRYLALMISFLGVMVALQFAGATERVFKLSPADADKTPQGARRPIKKFTIAQVIRPRQLAPTGEAELRDAWFPDRKTFNENTFEVYTVTEVDNKLKDAAAEVKKLIKEAAKKAADQAARDKDEIRNDIKLIGDKKNGVDRVRVLATIPDDVRKQFREDLKEEIREEIKAELLQDKQFLTRLKKAMAEEEKNNGN